MSNLTTPDLPTSRPDLLARVQRRGLALRRRRRRIAAATAGLAAAALVFGAASQLAVDGGGGYTVAADPPRSAGDQPPATTSPAPEAARPGDEVPSDPSRVPAPAGGSCQPGANEPSMAGGSYCGPEPRPGNGLGTGGVCTGAETAPPCGPGVEPGRWYPYTLAVTCDVHIFFNGQRWRSTLGPPPSEAASRPVWIRLSGDGQVGVLSPTTAVGYVPDGDGPPTNCAPTPAPSNGNTTSWGAPAPEPAERG